MLVPLENMKCLGTASSPLPCTSLLRVAWLSRVSGFPPKLFVIIILRDVLKKNDRIEGPLDIMGAKNANWLSWASLKYTAAQKKVQRKCSVDFPLTCLGPDRLLWDWNDTPQDGMTVTRSSRSVLEWAFRVEFHSWGCHSTLGAIIVVPEYCFLETVP